ncbi:MAG: hypothetical protein IJV15_02225 [Lachnospiraceae bacterium]|nr:hypothetical protein [Lachnospiraceae bacterium]
MKLKKIVAAALCCALLLTGSGFAKIDVSAEELEEDGATEASENTEEYNNNKSDINMIDFNLITDELYKSEQFNVHPYDADISLKLKTTKTIKKLKCYYPDGEHYIDEYNEDGNEIKYTHYDKNGNIDSFSECEYDENKKLKKISTYNADGSVKQYVIIEYDENEEKYIYYDQSGYLGVYEIYEYDPDGELILCKHYYGDCDYNYVDPDYDDPYYYNSYKTSYEYDSNKNLVYSSGGSGDWFYKNEYDSNENLTKHTAYAISFDEESNYYSYSTFKYDDNGNLIGWTTIDYNGDVTQDSNYDNDSDGDVIKTSTIIYGEYDDKPIVTEYEYYIATSPMYRLYNPNSGEHFYTANEDEKNNLVNVGWKYEGIGWYSDDAQSVPLYRQYNPNAKAGSHNYTTSKDENDWLESVGWKGEGIGWYGVK